MKRLFRLWILYLTPACLILGTSILLRSNLWLFAASVAVFVFITHPRNGLKESRPAQVALICGSLYVQVAAPEPFLEIGLLIAVSAALISLLNLMGHLRSRSLEEWGIRDFTTLWCVLFLFVCSLSGSCSNLTQAASMADEVEGRVVAKGRFESNHNQPAIRLAGKSVAVVVPEDLWNRLEIGSRIRKPAGTVFAEVDGQSVRWAPSNGNDPWRGIEPYKRGPLSWALLGLAVAGLAWSAVVTLRAWLRSLDRPPEDPHG